MLDVQQQSFDELHTLEEQFDYARSLLPLGKNEEALIYFRILKENYEEQQLYTRVMDCLGCICQCLGNTGRIAEMNNYLPDYKMYCDLYGKDIDKFKLNFYLGFVNSKVSQYEESIQYFIVARNIAFEIKENKLYCVVLINLLSVYLMVKDLKNMEVTAKQLLKMRQQYPQYFSINAEAALFLNYIKVLLDTGRFEKIPIYMQQYENLPGRDENIREQSFYYYIKGVYLVKQGYLSEGKNYLKNALIGYEETKEFPMYEYILESLIEVEEQQQNFKDALLFSKKLNDFMKDYQRLEMLKITNSISRQMDVDDLKELIYKDALTGIHNRRYLELKGKEMITEALLLSSEVYCVVFDIDSFKKINDTFGHLFGDEAIKQLAQNVKKYIGQDIIYTRYGGDEFVLLYKNIGNPQIFFENLFTKMAEMEATYKTMHMKFTISMGVVCLSKCEEKTLEGMIHEADLNLYLAKENGRNKLILSI